MPYLGRQAEGNPAVITGNMTVGETSADQTLDVASHDLVDGGLKLAGTLVTASAAEVNLLDGVSGLVQADLTKLAATDATAAELNLLNGVSGLVQADLTKLAAIDSSTFVWRLLPVSSICVPNGIVSISKSKSLNSFFKILGMVLS